MRWLNGYLLVELKGSSPERFLNLCRMRELYTWDINCDKNQYKFYMNIKDFKELKPIARKTKTMPKIKRRIGLPFYVSKTKTRVGFVAGFICFLCLILFMSKLIWSIEVKGQYTHTKEELMKYMNQNGIHQLILSKNVNCLALEESIRKEYEDIGWVSAQIDGTKLIVRIKETNMPKLYVQQTTPVHIVADRDGTIVSIVTRKGTPLVKSGDEVKAGDILISGVVDIIGDNQILLRKDPVVADGDIMLNTKYEYQCKKSLKYKGKDYTGKIAKEVRISVKDKELILNTPEIFTKNWKNKSELVEIKQTLFGSIDLVTRREYVEIQKMYSIEDTKAYLTVKLKKYIQKITEKGVIIHQINVKINRIGTNMVASGTLTVSQPVTTYRKILDSEWRNTENNEHSGNDN